jgi:hypothetical protein
MPESPIAALLKATDALDVDAFVSMFAADGRLLTADGTVAEGAAQVRTVISRFIDELSATSHEITAEWHPDDDVWIAELNATYELKGLGHLGPYPRAVVLRGGPDGVRELRVYGLHELPLTDTAHRYQEVFTGGRWFATL